MTGTKKRITKLAFALLGFGAALACTELNNRTRSEPGEGHRALKVQSTVVEDDCPMSVRGTYVHAHETQEGARLVFTTDGDATAVAHLRTRVRSLAERHQERPRVRRIVWEHVTYRADPPRRAERLGQRYGLGPMPPVRTAVKATPGGARLTVVPVDPADLALVRTRARAHAALMATGECWRWREVEGQRGASVAGESETLDAGPDRDDAAVSRLPFRFDRDHPLDAVSDTEWALQEDDVYYGRDGDGDDNANDGGDDDGDDDDDDDDDDEADGDAGWARGPAWR